MPDRPDPWNRRPIVRLTASRGGVTITRTLWIRVAEEVAPFLEGDGWEVTIEPLAPEEREDRP